MSDLRNKDEKNILSLYYVIINAIVYNFSLLNKKEIYEIITNHNLLYSIYLHHFILHHHKSNSTEENISHIFL